MIKCNCCGLECKNHNELAGHIIETIKAHQRSLDWAIAYKNRLPRDINNDVKTISTKGW